MDYRFRVEHDWDSRNSDGTFRQDRSRLRYRIRTGASYAHKNYSFGLRIRTGQLNKQQDPQLTLGKGLQEFGTLPIGFEKAYFQYNKSDFRFWIGKNTYPFKKNNELFWSDNVFPEGISIDKTFNIEQGVLKAINLTGGHFIINSSDNSFLNDAYLQGLQTNVISRNKHVELSSALYLLRNIPNIPDGSHSFLLDYSILHFRAKYTFKKISIDADYYNNLTNYDDNNNIEQDFTDQRTGYTCGVQYGDTKSTNNWMLRLTYARLQRYSILDYMAQNDWARWDYSSFNSPDGRLSNLQGAEAVVAYAISKKITLVTKYYHVDQLIPFGNEKETGQRIRFDINVKI